MYETIGGGNVLSFFYSGEPPNKNAASWIAPTDGSSDLLFVESYLHSATPIQLICYQDKREIAIDKSQKAIGQILPLFKI